MYDQSKTFQEHLQYCSHLVAGLLDLLIGFYGTPLISNSIKVCFCPSAGPEMVAVLFL